MAIPQEPEWVGQFNLRRKSLLEQISKFLNKSPEEIEKTYNISNEELERYLNILKRS